MATTDVLLPQEEDYGACQRSHAHHAERHFEYPRIMGDVIIGLSDGLTVPFSLAAGLASLDSSRLVVLAGFAELISGAISMGLGGYLACQSETEHYKSERRREEDEVRNDLAVELQECADVFAPYGISRQAMAPLLAELASDKENLVNFMMAFELGLEKPEGRTAMVSGLTIAISYFLGGLLPLLPYLLISKTLDALYVSIGLTALVLFVFGWLKCTILRRGARACLLSALQTMTVGLAAAGASFGLVRLLDQGRV
ncbi:Ccc1 family [Protomyces lactucae-debilis]|uniref:Ccc1 family n=1 Tax=Protomyces lactucae-debilis TaxID=2754530 RepID=A0A1Y2FET7_PROLT|nr:Ccc1 family [Protomyces lactucae-debilis]ORY82439.1 Ccc1 family [Protomyces lactucae-debilis]